MKAYVLTTGMVFGLIVIAHLARVVAEDYHPLKEPTFVVASILALFLAGWAWRIFRRLSQPTKDTPPPPR